MEINDSTHPVVANLIKNRLVLLINLIGISLVAVGYSFFFAKVLYKSDMCFLPPVSQAALPIALPKSMAASSLLSSTFDPEQMNTIFSSKSITRNIIDRFDLISYYKLQNDRNCIEKAIRRCNKDLLLSYTENESNRLASSKILSYTLTAYHRSPDTSALLVTYAFSLIDSTVQAINRDRANRNRVYIDRQLAKKRHTIDSLNGAMLRFQKETKGYDPLTQMAITLKTLARLKAEALAIEIKIRELKLKYNYSTPEITALQKTLSSYNKILSSLERNDSPDVLPSLDYAASIIPVHNKIVRDIEIQNELLVLLSSEGEKAKLKESNSTSQLTVIDAAFKPDYKTKPNRGVLTGKIIVFYMFFLVVLIIYYDFYDRWMKGSPFIRALFAGNEKSRQPAVLEREKA